MFNKGDIILIHHIDMPGYDMHAQVDVPLEDFPLPALVKECSERIIDVFWVHPVSKVHCHWHFLNKHFDKMELLEAS